MKTVMHVDRLKKEWHGRLVFKDVSFTLTKGQHVAVFGQNGVGKTTLLKALAGDIGVDEGSIFRAFAPDEWGVVQQHVHVPHTWTVFDVASAAFPKWQAAYKALQQAEQDLREDTNAYDRYEVAYESFLSLGGYDQAQNIRQALLKRGLPEAIHGVSYDKVSGGQKTKTQWAQIMLKDPPLVLMDEPTNHLDHEGMNELAHWMNHFKGTILYVSHDRYFLDETAHALLELTSDGTSLYQGNYTAYKEQKAVEQRTQETQYRKEQQEKKALEESIRRYHEWFSQAHKSAGTNDFLRSKAKKNISRYHAKLSSLQKLNDEGIEKPQETETVSFQLEADTFAAKSPVRMENVSFAYGEKDIFSNVTLRIHTGDRLAILGENGSGKSTLLKILSAQLLPDEGRVAVNPQTRIGFFAQELEELNEEVTLLDHLLELPGMTQTEARTILASFLFRKDDVFKSVQALSMGEKCRLAFIRLYFSGANVLMLDEPTNYLDVPTREIVEDVLQSYQGTIVLISHDRYMVQRLATRIVALHDSGVEVYNGTFSEYKEANERPPRSDREKEEERKRLQFAYEQLIAFDEKMTEVDKEHHVEKIRQLKAKIDQLET
ncbi:ABC-F type ribosomal protection protein [Bacillaceae bacterium SIJ1]|uniref:ribosomal protection-like ABC-F family protein n=1 Tax=Litoribacterium kuwaitense TaxID=1398745 RepID=UPI0013E9A5C5|nr:ABC-F type ribosomal protection protein [Litoribacterium kuwaitense]NGP45062.1 ABC-F type ribosomal protection protein [Litoribacterium kuwaitense]